jgi:long-chain acyl-CoA synthetase
VESAILAHSDVQDCLVKGRDSSVLGQLVVAEILLNKANNAIVEELRELCREILPKHAVPRIFTIVEEIRQSTAGKKVRD